MRRVRTFIQQNRAHFLASFPDLTPQERRVVGFAEAEVGSIGQVASANG
jgi:hypothetical protein